MKNPPQLIIANAAAKQAFASTLNQAKAAGMSDSDAQAAAQEAHDNVLSDALNNFAGITKADAQGAAQAQKQIQQLRETARKAGPDSPEYSTLVAQLNDLGDTSLGVARPVAAENHWYKPNVPAHLQVDTSGAGITPPAAAPAAALQPAGPQATGMSQAYSAAGITPPAAQGGITQPQAQAQAQPAGTLMPVQGMPGVQRTGAGFMVKRDGSSPTGWKAYDPASAAWVNSKAPIGAKQ
jgi:hypothetical protein